MTEDFKIVAVVRFNDGEAIVLNRKPRFLFEFMGRDLVGEDGPFRRLYGYAPPSGRFKAFAGAKFDIPMKDGSFIKASGQYWDSCLPDFAGVTYSTIEDLLNCYVFTGSQVDRDWYSAERNAYTGCVYPYWDYEKVIKYDVERMKWITRAFKLEKDKRHLIAKVKDAHRRLSEVSA